jgi:hypothetical protein
MVETIKITDKAGDLSFRILRENVDESFSFLNTLINDELAHEKPVLLTFIFF